MANSKSEAKNLIEIWFTQILKLHDVTMSWKSNDTLDITNSEGKIFTIYNVYEQIKNLTTDPICLEDAVELAKHFCNCKSNGIRLQLYPDTQKTLIKIEFGKVWFYLSTGFTNITDENSLREYLLVKNNPDITKQDGQIISFKPSPRFGIDFKCLDKLFEICKNIVLTDFIKNGLEQVYNVKIVSVDLDDLYYVWVTDNKERLIVKKDVDQIGKSFDKINNIDALNEIKKLLDNKIMLEEKRVAELEEKRRLENEEEELRKKEEEEKLRLANEEERRKQEALKVTTTTTETKTEYTQDTLINTCSNYKRSLKTGLLLVKEDFTTIFNDDYNVESIEHQKALEILNYVIYDIDPVTRNVLLAELGITGYVDNEANE